ncbi:MAG TPA: hypothetical protein DDY29_13990 [Rhodobacteraceae bacterium]|jgi:hypothetical protein|nr:sulfotransferase family protein [Paracoccaceae bacterium]HBG99771.1 hypothetical protein [Paracoccaceae bacterium]
MGFPGLWMTQSGSTAYRVIPKCACSTIGQILYFSDHGRFYDGDVHDATDGIHKWGIEASRAPITEAVRTHSAYAFTAVRNPYRRILSSFFDKICGVQRNGRPYRGNLVPKLTQAYGVQIDGDFDQIAAFRRFLLFARDTVRWRRPMDPDIHWSAMASHAATFVANGGTFDHVFHVEHFAAGMQTVLDAVATPHPVVLADVPRFNESSGHGPKRAHPVEAYFDDLSRHLMLEMYHRDFAVFGYDPDNPARAEPVEAIDLEALHAKLLV